MRNDFVIELSDWGICQAHTSTHGLIYIHYKSKTEKLTRSRTAKKPAPIIRGTRINLSMKPTLLLNSGVAFSATSPLHYTLCWDNKYAHTGHCKEHHYLHILETGDKLVKDEFLKAKRQIQHRRNPPILCPDSEYVKFKGENFFCDDITIDRYISYYLEHWDNIKNDYKENG